MAGEDTASPLSTNSKQGPTNGASTTPGSNMSPLLASRASGSAMSTSRSSGLPEMVVQNPPINTLYVGNLAMLPPPWGYTNDYLEEILREVFSARPGFRRLCFRIKANGPMCFVEFENVAFASTTLREMAGDTLCGIVQHGIRLSYSKNPLGVRTPTSAGGSGSSEGSTPLQSQQMSQRQEQQRPGDAPPPPQSGGQQGLKRSTTSPGEESGRQQPDQQHQRHSRPMAPPQSPQPGQHGHQPRSPKTWVQDAEDGRWKSTPPSKDYRQQDDALTREMERVVLGSLQHLTPPAPPGRESTAQAAMFTNAHINAIQGGTFLNVAQIYECESGGGPAFPIMVLGLQAVSFATRSHYPCYIQPSDPLPLLIPEPTSTSGLAIHFPLIYQEMKTAIGPLALWLLIKMWIQRRSIERH